jgi:hypothetical protein
MVGGANRVICGLVNKSVYLVRAMFAFDSSRYVRANVRAKAGID